MNKKSFPSQIYPEMNLFWGYLQCALECMNDNPKSDCFGFCVSYWDIKKKVMHVEQIGCISSSLRMRYFYLASNKLARRLYLETINKEEMNDLLTASHEIAVFGHDPAINEAIEFLWKIAKKIIEENSSSTCFLSSPFFFYQMRERASELQIKFAPKNDWLTKIVGMIKVNS